MHAAPPARFRKGKRKDPSKPKQNPDGTALRRRYAFYAASLFLFLSAVIALLAMQGRSGRHAKASAAKTAYKVVQEFHHGALDGELKVLEHIATGLQVVTMVPSDITQDATFGMSFPMKLEDNQGTPHVVEHCVKDGSMSYPIQDPFNQLAQGSLQTYEDSWTHKDRTSFVVSSRNLQDFKNAMKVHLDAFFNPLFVQDEHKWIFRQEAWRIDSDDGGNFVDLIGNAINEARAAETHPVPTMMNEIFKQIYDDDHPYSRNARGFTEDIVDMTYEEAVAFHERTYHPSNAHGFCFGAPEFIEQCLNLIDPAVKRFDKHENLRPSNKIDPQPLSKLSDDIHKVEYSTYAEDMDDYRLGMAWLLNDSPMSGVTEAALFILEELLFTSKTSLVGRIAHEKGYGTDISGGLEYTLQQWMMILGFSGIPSDEEVQSAIQQINNGLKTIAEEGFDEDDLAAAINQVDFKLRDVTYSKQPLGVKVFGRVLSKWHYGLDAEIQLLYKHFFDEVVDDIKKNGQGVLLDLVTKMMVDNTHRVMVELVPSDQIARRFKDNDDKFFQKLNSDLTNDEIHELILESQAVAEHHEEGDTAENLEKVPRLAVKDLDLEGYEVPVKIDFDLLGSGIDALEVEVPNSNGIAYVEFAMDISNMDFDDVVLLPLFCRMMEQAGTEKYSEVQLSQAIETHTGSFEVYPLIEDILKFSSDNVHLVPNGNHLVTKIVMSGSAIADEGGVMLYSILQEILYRTNFRNRKAARNILTTLIDTMEDEILVEGDLYTTYRIESRYSFPGYVREQWKGVTQLINLRRELDKLENNFTELADRLEAMRDSWIYGSRSGMLLTVTGDKQAIVGMRSATEIFFHNWLGDPENGAQRFPDFAKTTHPWMTKGLNRMKQSLQVEGYDEVFLAPTRVNHVGKGGILFDAGEEIHGSDEVVTEFISSHFLYDQLQFGFGAADARASLDIDAGAVVFQTRSDPYIVNTLNIYEDAANFVLNALSHSTTELPIEAVSSIVGTIGEMDGSAAHPSRAGRVAMLRYLTGETPESRQKWRDEILGTTRDDFLKMVDRLGSWGLPSVVVVASPRHYQTAHNGGGLNLTQCDYTGFSC